MATDTKYYVDGSGNWLGAFVTHDDEASPIVPPDGAVEVPSAPHDARAVWVTDHWDYSAAVDPDPTGFEQAVKAAVGGIVQANALAAKYPLLHPAVQERRWDDVQALIIDAHSNAVLSDGQYNGIKSLASEFHIPITLP